jgi:hypothetical protein
MHTPHPEQAPEAAGTVIVDIGEDVGAAVIHTPAELTGAEIEIRAAGTEWDGAHTGVWERRGPGIIATAAVFGSLPAGCYELRIKGHPGTEHPALIVVEGARVTQVTWAGGGLTTIRSLGRSCSTERMRALPRTPPRAVGRGRPSRVLTVAWRSVS